MNDEEEQQQQSDESESDDNYVFSVGTGSKQPITNVIIQGTRIKMIIDSGSSVNIVDHKQWSLIKNKPQLKPAESKLYAYGSRQPIDIIGKCDCKFESSDKISVSTVYVAKGSNVSLLSYKTATELGLLKININTINTDEQKITVDDLVRAHPELFSGIAVSYTHLRAHETDSY